MRRKGFIIFGIIIFIIALGCLGIGFYFNSISKSSYLMGVGIDTIEQKISHYFYPGDELLIGDNFTAEGSFDFDLDSEYYKSHKDTDPEALKMYHRIQNFNQLESRYVLKYNANNKNAFLEMQGKIGEESILSSKILVDNSTEYFFLDGAVKNYINNGTCNYFENINDENTTNDVVDYLYNFFFASLKKNLKEEYFKRYQREENIGGKSQSVEMISIRLTDSILHKIEKGMLEDFKEDERASKILTNIFSDFPNYKIDTDRTYLEKDESITINLYTTRFLYKPVKYEVIHLKGEETGIFLYEGDSNDGTFYYIENNQTKYQVPVDFGDRFISLKIHDSFGESVGEVKLEKDGNNTTLNYFFDDGHMKQDFIYSSKYTFDKKGKGYENTTKLAFKILEDKVSRMSGDISYVSKVEGLAKIEEDVSMATLASKLTEEEKNKIDGKWESLKERMDK